MMIPLLDVRARDAGDARARRSAMLARIRTLRPFAGGTDLMVLLEAGKLPTPLRQPWVCGELRGITQRRDDVAIGALTTYTEIRAIDGAARRSSRCCARRGRETGGVATQNRGTIGGNIANASPAADTPPALLVYDAELELVSVRRPGGCPTRAFHTGYKKMDLAPGELIARDPSAARGPAAGASTTARSARAARRRSRRCASPARSCGRGRRRGRPHRARQRGADRGPLRCAPKARCAAGGSTIARSPRSAALRARDRADRRHAIDRAISRARRAEPARSSSCEVEPTPGRCLSSAGPISFPISLPLTG